MKPVVALRQVAHEGLGTLEDAFRSRQLPHNYIDLYRDAPRTLSPEHLSGLVVLGGPMNVDDTDRYPFLETELTWIRAALNHGIPILGICLGSQLLAKALGARVYPNDIKEIGWYEIELTAAAAADPLFESLPTLPTVFQWHGDTFDLPADAVHLAAAPRCAHQAFRYGSRAYGLQFHLEVTEQMIERWFDVPENRSEIAGLDDIDPAEIRRRLPRDLPQMQQLGEKAFGAFADMCAQFA